MKLTTVLSSQKTDSVHLDWAFSVGETIHQSSVWADCRIPGLINSTFAQWLKPFSIQLSSWNRFFVVVNKFVDQLNSLVSCLGLSWTLYHIWSLLKAYNLFSDEPGSNWWKSNGSLLGLPYLSPLTIWKRFCGIEKFLNHLWSAQLDLHTLQNLPYKNAEQSALAGLKDLTIKYYSFKNLHKKP